MIGGTPLLARMTTIRCCALLGLFLALLAAPSWAAAGPIEIAHEQGLQAGSVFLASGYGHAVSFSPPSLPWQIMKIRLYGFRYGDGTEKLEFTVEIWVANRSALSAPFPYAAFKTVSAWIDVDLTDIVVTGDFSVALYTNSAPERGIKIGFDSSVANQHSDIVYGKRVITDWNQVNWKPISPTPPKRERTNWMVRVIGSAPPTTTLTKIVTTTPTSSQTSALSFLNLIDSRVFQIVGAVATGGSIILGWFFKTSKRRLVSAYLRKIDLVYETHSAHALSLIGASHQPALAYLESKEKCKKQLAEMKEEIFQMLEKGKIDESQFSVIDAKLAQYLRDLG